MKSEAIRSAVKLHSEPMTLARFTDSYRKLPRGMTELLRLASSETALKQVALKNGIQANQLRAILINYIKQVLLIEDHSDYRKLGLESSGDEADIKLHYKLLMNIFHPDKSQDNATAHYSHLIQKAYKSLRQNHQGRQDKKSDFSLDDKDYISFKRRSGRKKNKQKKHNRYQKVAIIAGVALFSFVIWLLIAPSSPKIVKKASPTDSNSKLVRLNNQVLESTD